MIYNHEDQFFVLIKEPEANNVDILVVEDVHRSDSLVRVRGHKISAKYDRTIGMILLMTLGSIAENEVIHPSMRRLLLHPSDRK